MSRIIFVVFALAALWAGYWVIGSRALESRLTDWLDARRAEGWVAEAGEVSVRGFPNRFDTTIETLTLADPETGVAWAMPFFQILALSYRPNHVIAVWPDSQVLATPAERLDVTSGRMRGSVIFRPNTALALDRTTIVMEEVALSSSGGWNAGLAEGRLATRPAGRPLAHDIAFEARDVAPGGALLALLDPRGRLPRSIGLLRLDTTVEFDAALDRFAIEDRRPQPVQLEIDDFSAVWGALEIRAAGTLAIANGVPEGRITIRAVNWREILGIAESLGMVPEPLSDTVESALELLAGLSGRPDTLDVPLSFAGGRVAFGPIPLGPAPRLVIP